MSTGPDIAAIHRRICRLHSTTWDKALLFVMPSGEWRVIRDGAEPMRCWRMEAMGLFVGAYTSMVGFDQLSEDVEAHINDLRA